MRAGASFSVRARDAPSASEGDGSAVSGLDALGTDPNSGNGISGVAGIDKGAGWVYEHFVGDLRFGLGAVHYPSLKAQFQPGGRGELFSESWEFAMEIRMHFGWKLGPVGLLFGMFGSAVARVGPCSAAMLSRACAGCVVGAPREVGVGADVPVTDCCTAACGDDSAIGVAAGCAATTAAGATSTCRSGPAMGRSRQAKPKRGSQRTSPKFRVNSNAWISSETSSAYVSRLRSALMLVRVSIEPVSSVLGCR